MSSQPTGSHGNDVPLQMDLVSRSLISTSLIPRVPASEPNKLSHVLLPLPAK